MTSSFGPPSALLVEITSRCNLTCKMCPLTAGDTASGHSPGNISPDEWREVLVFAREVGRVYVGGYGEPFSNQECLTYLADLDAAGVRICVTTNGTMVNEKVARALAAIEGLENVNVSIDSPDPDLYREIRGGDLGLALSGVRRLAAALGPSRLTVSSVMMRRNIESLSAFPVILASMGIRNYVLQGLVDYTPGLDHEEIHRSDGLSAHIDRIRQAASVAGVGIVFELPARTAAEMQAPQPAAERRETDTRQCFAPWDEPVVDKDGRVFPCCFAMTHAQSMLGDLKTERFAAIWHGAKFADFRRKIVDGRTTPEICRMCTVAPTGPHLFRELSVELVHGESRLSGTDGLRLVVRNTGTATWTRSDEIHIGTASPRDAVSALHHQTWIGGNRIGTFFEESVPPGSTATFAFEVTPGDAAVTETFQLVAEHRAWLPGTRFQVSVPRQPMSRLQAALRALGASR